MGACVYYQTNSIEISVTVMNKNMDASMNLPVHNHIARLGQLIQEMRMETDEAQKDLHILRGCISQLSFVNKQSDSDLNQYLLSAINLMRSKWGAQWENQKKEIQQNHKKIQKIITQQEDIQLERDQLQQVVQNIQTTVGHVN